MGAMASQITSLTIAYSTVYWGVDQRKHQNSASQAFVRGIHRHKWPVTRKVFPLDDVIMYYDNWFINDRITFVIKNVFKTLKNIQLPVGFSIYHRCATAQLWWHLSNMNVIKIICRYFCDIENFVYTEKSANGALVTTHQFIKSHQFINNNVIF